MTRARKELGAWYTPDELVAKIVEHVITAEFVDARTSARRPIRVLDPACGDGRFLAAAARRIGQLGGSSSAVGVDIDASAVGAATASVPDATIVHADALHDDWHPTGTGTGTGRDDATFDLVVGNPPFLSQLNSATSRGGASERGGGPYADAAVEFLALAAELVEPHGGRVALVLPQSVLSARDGAAVRRSIDERADMVWSWWSDERVFDAQVYTCALAFEFHLPPTTAGPPGALTGRAHGSWAHVATRHQGVPALPELNTAGTLGDRARLNANFRDEYYGMVPAVGDHDDGPPLITSGAIDPGCTLWGTRPVTFAKQRFARPRIDIERLDPKMQRWADDRLVPKVLVANQTQIIEAVCDEHGDWLPAVPVVAAYPASAATAAAWRIAAVLTSPVASAWVWHRSAGTGLSTSSVRVGPVLLADLPWPAGGSDEPLDATLDAAVAALRRGDTRGCARAVCAAYGVVDDAQLFTWWERSLLRIEARRAARPPATAKVARPVRSRAAPPR